MTPTAPVPAPVPVPVPVTVPSPVAPGGAREPVTVRLDGELDIATCGAARTALLGAVDGAPAALFVDLSAVTFLDASGLAVLVAARRYARRRGTAFAVVAPSRPARLALRASGLWRLLEVRDPAAAQPGAVPPPADGTGPARGLTAG